MRIAGGALRAVGANRLIAARKPTPVRAMLSIVNGKIVRKRSACARERWSACRRTRAALRRGAVVQVGASIGEECS